VRTPSSWRVLLQWRCELAAPLRPLLGVERRVHKLRHAPARVCPLPAGLTATPAIAQAVHAYIRSWLRDAYGPAVADAVRIQYGGSVTPDSVAAIMQAPDVDGAATPLQRMADGIAQRG
jgi:hypothetical protein